MAREYRERYEDVVEDVASYLKGEEQQDAARRILDSKKARETYDILIDTEMPYSTIKKVMIEGLEGFQNGKGLTPGTYAMAMAKQLLKNEKHADAVDEMLDDEIISQNQYELITSQVKNHSTRHIKALQGGLEKLTASILAILGFGLILGYGTTITGNVINSSVTSIPGFSAGIILIIISLTLFFRSFIN